ncbi:MAG: IS701 family transposase [Streptosporangiaceae bacterium]
MLTVVDDARVRAGDGHAAWSESFNEMFAQVAGLFGNAAVRRHGRGYLLGLLSHTERKNSWSLAEFAGDVSPDGMQRLLNFSPWDEDGCRDAVARYVARNLGDAGAVLAVDETGFLKKGRRSAGVARQYTGTAGRVENAQVGVFLAYAAPDGSRALIDRELYLPEKWASDRERCRAAGIGDGVRFAAKPQLAKSMIGCAVAAGVPFSWVTGDEAYGGNPGLREWLEKEKIPFVLGIACNAMIATGAGAKRADGLAGLVPAAGWQRLSCADSSKGPRLYDWALIATISQDHWLLVRRSLHRREKGGLELAFFRCYSPRPVALPELVAVAGARWAVEDCFAEAKNEAGPDHYQVRQYRSWYRHVTLSMLAHAFLAVTARAVRPAPPEPAPASENTGSEPAKKGT